MPAGDVLQRHRPAGVERQLQHGLVAERVRSRQRQRRVERRNLFIRSKVDSIPIRIDRPYIKPIVDFFKMRERRL